MVRVDRPQIRLDVQGRFEQVPRNIWGPVNATHLTSIVATSNQSVPIEVIIIFCISKPNIYYSCIN